MSHRGQVYRSADVQGTLGTDAAGREMVPAPQVLHRYVESIGNRHQGVTGARYVAQGMRQSGGRDRDHKFIARRNRVVRRELVDICELSGALVEARCDCLQGFARLQYVEAPGRALVLRTLR